RPGDPHVGGAAALGLPALAVGAQRVLLRRGFGSRLARGGLPAGDPRLRLAGSPVRRMSRVHVSDSQGRKRMSGDSEQDGLEEYRASFDGEPGYLDWAAFGPLSPAVRTALHADAELLGSGRRSGMTMVEAPADEARELLAAPPGAPIDAVTRQPATSD